MHRRSFLNKSALLIPAIIAVPTVLFAAGETAMVSVLFVQGAGKKERAHTAATIRNAFDGNIEELGCKQIRGIEFNGSCFSVTTTDNRVVKAKKIVFDTFFKIDSPGNSIEIKTVNTSFHLNFGHAAGNPEFWSFGSGQFSTEKLQPFVKRKGNAFLCIS